MSNLKDVTAPDDIPRMDIAAMQKKMAAMKALPFIKDGMVLGLGTGSTADIFLELLADYIQEKNYKISAISSSDRTRQKALSLNIPLLPMGQTTETDLCIDGTDEFNDSFYLIKGGGGALLCEKIIARSAKKMIVITDERKYSKEFGQFPLPIEIVDFETGIILANIKNIHAKFASCDQFTPNIRRTKDGKIFRTDMGHMIVDVPFSGIQNVHALSDALLNIPGVVEHGLFLNEARIILTDQRELRRT
ncbi:MAG: ribose-5-phosphate isomerase RpiA [Pseudomonadota bacterium]